MHLPRIILPAVLFMAYHAAAQQELMLHQHSQLWHAAYTNPSFFPADKKIVIGLPSYGLDAAHSGDITYNDILRREGDRTILDLGKALDIL